MHCDIYKAVKFFHQSESYLVAAIIISIITLCLSIIVAYVAYFRPPKIEMLVGNKLTFYPLPELINGTTKWGGISFYIPITFHNWSPSGGSVQEVRAIIEKLDNPSVNYDIAWSTFSGMHETELQWVNKGVAQPIALNGKCSDSKVIQFNWSSLSGEVLNIEAGEYRLRILGSKPKDKTPSLKYENTFVLTKEVVKQHEIYKNKNEPRTVEVTLGESSRLNTVLSRKQIKDIYKV